MKRTLESSEPLDSVSILHHLLRVSENLCGRRQDVQRHLSQEVAFVTRNKVVLIFENSSRRQPWLEQYALNMPVRFGNIDYGMLVAHIQDEMFHHELPISTIQMLASLCGSILYTCELSLIMQESSQKSTLHDYSAVTRSTFTKRQWDVLQLICRGYTKEQIIQRLSIAPSTLQKHRQAIYNRLHVNNEHEIPLVAYQMGLYLPLHPISLS